MLFTFFLLKSFSLERRCGTYGYRDCDVGNFDISRGRLISYSHALCKSFMPKINAPSVAIPLYGQANGPETTNVPASLKVTLRHVPFGDFMMMPLVLSVM